jgi:hypothetical protein
VNQNLHIILAASKRSGPTRAIGPFRIAGNPNEQNLFDVQLAAQLMGLGRH